MIKKTYIRLSSDGNPEEIKVKINKKEIVSIEAYSWKAERNGEDGWLVTAEYNSNFKTPTRLSYCDLDTCSTILKIWQDVEEGWSGDVFGEIRKL